ncbi:MAG: hypothetical protein ACYDD4_02085 [Acidimicrobiales bacterium]
MALLGVVLVAGALGGLTSAAANAANPAPTTQGTATLNADGTVTVALSGTWVWANQSCAGRYGEGYAIDWWGVSASSAPSPSFALTNATAVTSPGSTTTGNTVAPTGALAIKGSANYFHVGTYYAGEDVNSSSTCADTGSGGSTGSTGPWSASATYPSASDLPADLCVNMYDEHGQEGTISGSAKDFSPSGDKDNSIDTNSFDPTVGNGYCVALHVTPTSQIAGHIYQCSNGTTTTTEVSGGTLAANGPTTVTSTANPMAPTTVTSGSYTMSATSPSGWAFTACGASGVTIGSPPSAASQPVTVPSGGTGTGIFYVQPLTQVISGHIYQCSNGTTTTTEVSGGTLAANGPSTVPSTVNPMTPTAVSAGTFTMDATAPSGWEFTTCGAGNSVTIASPPTGASEPVTVPSGGSGVGVFYVTPQSGTVVLTVVKTNDADGSGTYSQSETAQAPGANVPFRAVVTNDSSFAVSISSLTDSWPGQAAFAVSCATTVAGTTLQPGQSATCDFTANGYAPAAGTSLTDTVTVSGCSTTDATDCGTATATSTVLTFGTAGSGSVTLQIVKTNDAAGTGTFSQSEEAKTVGENVPFHVTVTNTSAVPVTISALTDAWPSEAPFSPTCAAAVVGTTLAPGASTTCAFTVDNYAPAAGNALTNTVTVNGCEAGNTGNCGTWTATSTVATPGPATAAASGLAFTGPPAHLQMLLEIGSGLMSMGFFLLWFTRPRRVRQEQA